MSNIATNIPLPIAPLAGPDGRINEVWWRFFLDIFNRTGGGSGNDGGIDAIYPDISATTTSSDSIGNLSPMEALFAMPSVAAPLPELTMMSALPDQSLSEISLGIQATDQSLQEMVMTPVLATDSPMFSGLYTDGSTDILFGVNTSSFRVRARGANSGTAGGTGFFADNAGTNILFMGNKSIKAGGAYDATPYIFSNAPLEFSNNIKVPGGAQFIQTTNALTNGAGAATGTLTNAPAAGNPTKWIGVNDNGTIRYVPSW